MTRRAAPPQHLPENEPQKPPAQSCKDSKAERKTAYRSAGCRCQRCHGPEGKGNGPEADPNVKPADLTQIKTDINPDGVLFYKVWNGHQPHAGSKGSMPAFKVQTTRDEVWRVIEYVKTLRNPAT